MKRITILMLLVVLFQMFSQAQKYVNEYGKISGADIDLKTYTPDDKAEAVVIYDLGSSYFARVDNYFEVIYERTTRIKILKDSGKEWADIEIPFYQEGDIFEEVYDIEACTYNFVDGELIKTQFDTKNS